MPTPVKRMTALRDLIAADVSVALECIDAPTAKDIIKATRESLATMIVPPEIDVVVNEKTGTIAFTSRTVVPKK